MGKRERSAIVSVAWTALGAAVVVGLVTFAFWLPAAAPETAPPDEFSAARALRVVRALTEEIGQRPNDSPAHLRAAEYLAAELRKLPGVAVELQRVGGVAQYGQELIPFPPFVYETVNVIARIEGRRKSAVLLDAHFDTLTDSVGAGDDAMGVAAIVETARALAAGPKREHSVVIALNGGEEMGLLGAAGFLKHRYARDVRAYVYLDGGPGGKPVVIGAGPGNPWLLRAYAGAAPSPAVTVVAEDVIASGLLPHSGDFVPFHEAGLVGIDLAALGDFWAIHTHLDRADRVDPGTLQQLGDALLAGTHGLLDSDLPGNVEPSRHVYYDLIGLAVPVYSHVTARVLAVVALALVGVALVLARRRGVLTVRQMAGALGRTALVVLAAFCAALLVAALLGLVIGRPHGWFAAPWVGVAAFGLPAGAAALGVLALRRRHPPERAPLALWAGALLFWSLLLLLSTIAGAGSGYLPLWWTGCGALGLIGALLRPAWQRWMWLVAFVPGATLTLELIAPIYPFTIADIGLVPAPAPLDMLVAALVGLTAAALLPLLLVPIAGAGRLGRAAAVLAALAVVGAGIAAFHPPYSAQRPKRVRAAVAVRDGRSKLLVASGDALPIDPVLAAVDGVRPTDPPWSPVFGLDPPFTRELPADPPWAEPPRIEVISSRYDPADDARRVRIRLVTGGSKLVLYVPTAPLERWSIGAIPAKSLDAERTLVVFQGAPPADREIDLVLAGQAPVELELIETRGPSERPEVRALAAQLPAWTALHAQDIWSVKQEI